MQNINWNFNLLFSIFCLLFAVFFFENTFVNLCVIAFILSPPCCLDHEFSVIPDAFKFNDKNICSSYFD